MINEIRTSTGRLTEGTRVQGTYFKREIAGEIHSLVIRDEGQIGIIVTIDTPFPCSVCPDSMVDQVLIPAGSDDAKNLVFIR